MQELKMTRKKFSANFKAQVALEVIKNDSTLAELAKKHGVHPTQIKDWKATLLSQAETIFSRKSGKIDNNSDYIEALERKAGQQAIEIDFLKKNLTAYHKRNE
jgi:transposase-like protein